MISVVDEYATAAGFHLTRHHRVGKNYVKTLDSWSKALPNPQRRGHRAAVRRGGEGYLHYLTGCRELFRDGYTDVRQFTLEKKAR